LKKTIIMNIFTYGTLMFAEIWSRLIPNKYRQQPAFLSGYVRKVVKAQQYPAIYRAQQHTTITGILYFALQQTDIATLDRFEGTCYERLTERVLLDSGEPVEAAVYVLRDSCHHIVSNTNWDAALFKDQIDRFINEYCGFKKG
jgi:gamma-glutamylcyclotransferase (GGCT)/AIG2-like uncharacterized protein YtfP